MLLTAMNFVNYIDRYILPGVQEQVKGEFRISDDSDRVADVLVLRRLICVRRRLRAGWATGFRANG